MIKKVVLLALSLFVTGCVAPAGYYHPDGHPFTLVALDPCQRPELTSGNVIRELNSTKGKLDGVPHTIIGIQDSHMIDPADWTRILIFNKSSTLSDVPDYSHQLNCHANLVFANHTIEGGVFTLTDPGGNAPLLVSWISNESILEKISITKEDEKKKKEAGLIGASHNNIFVRDIEFQDGNFYRVYLTDHHNKYCPAYGMYWEADFRTTDGKPSHVVDPMCWTMTYESLVSDMVATIVDALTEAQIHINVSPFGNVIDFTKYSYLPAYRHYQNQMRRDIQQQK
ncbi:MAG: hypothetical protein ACYCT9_13280 [Leptospirillum sp.]